VPLEFDPEKINGFPQLILSSKEDEDLASLLFSRKKRCSRNYTLLDRIFGKEPHLFPIFGSNSSFSAFAPTAYDEKASKNWKQKLPALS
jgi:glutamyl-tRNA synthetase